MSRAVSMTPPDSRDQRIAELEEEVAFLRSALKQDFRMPEEWRLQKMQRTIFAVLLRRETSTYAAIAAAMWSTDPQAELPSESLIKVHVHHIRRKLQPFGVEIVTDHGRGYRLRDQRIWRDRLGSA